MWTDCWRRSPCLFVESSSGEPSRADAVGADTCTSAVRHGKIEELDAVHSGHQYVGDDDGAPLTQNESQGFLAICRFTYKGHCLGRRRHGEANDGARNSKVSSTTTTDSDMATPCIACAVTRMQRIATFQCRAIGTF